MLLAVSSMQSGTHGTLGNRTGSNGSNDGCNSCHGDNANTATVITIELLSGGTPVTSYTPGATYTVRLNGQNQTNARSKFGFQLTAANNAGTSVGTMATNGVSGVATKANNTLIEHSQPLDGTLSPDNNYTYVREFSWTAPAAGAGTVKFYAVLNAVNGNGTPDANGGDQWNKGQSVNITEEQGSSLKQQNLITGLAVFPNPAGKELSLVLNTTDYGAYEVTIVDLSGRILQSKMHMHSGSGQSFRSDIASLASGTYLLNVKHNGKEVTTKFQKL
ncbi:MAG: T9SS type A sorting domain-containing protein [Sphingobacteriales bacterium]|nr:MAG: T9SS type A sorting domain-containing protein [Sphingobacteriales bacterium]